MSSLFVNSLEDEDYDVGECHCNLGYVDVIIIVQQKFHCTILSNSWKVPCSVSGLYNLCVYGPTI